MGRDDIINIIQENIFKIKSKINGSLTKMPNISRQFLIIELVRNIDSLYCLYRTSPHDLSDAFFNYFHAWPDVLTILYSNFNNMHSYPLSPSNEDTANWMSSCLYYYGLCKRGDNLIGLLKNDMYDYCYQNKSTVALKPKSHDAGIEIIETQQILTYFRELADAIQTEYDDPLKAEAQDVLNDIEKEMYVYNEHFIGYGSTPNIDMHFSKLGILLLEQTFSADSFASEAQFNHIPYAAIHNTLAHYMGINMKHMLSCKSLLKTNPQLNLSNLITIVNTYDDIVKYISIVSCLPITIAKKIARLLIFDYKDYLSWHEEGNLPYPLFIEIAKNIYIRSNAGLAIDPLSYVFWKIKKLYPSDWSRAVEERELFFKTQLYSLFSNKQYFCVKNKRLKIYIQGKLATDLDALIYDRKNKTLGLFQLKWQEPFGSSEIQRQSRKKNLIKNGNKWIDTVFNWLELASAEEISNSLGMKVGLIKNINKTYLFVIGRYFSSFSDECNKNHSAAWGNWYNTIKLLKIASPQENNLIEYLYQKLTTRSKPEKYSIHALQFENIRFTFNLVDSS